MNDKYMCVCLLSWCVPQELRLGRGGVPDHEHVDVPAEMRPVGQRLLHAWIGLDWVEWVMSRWSYPPGVTVDKRTHIYTLSRPTHALTYPRWPAARAPS